MLPSLPSISAAVGLPPSVLLKLCKLVKVCAGAAIAVAAQSNKMISAFFQKLSFAMVILPFLFSRLVLGPERKHLNRTLALRVAIRAGRLRLWLHLPWNHGRVWDAHLSMTTSAARNGFAGESC